MVYKYIKYADRLKIAKLYDMEMSVEDIAKEIGCHFSTIYAELSRGYTGKLNKYGRLEYSPDLAQKNIRASIARRGNRKRKKAVVDHG